MSFAAEIADRLDLVDVFALRRISDQQLVNLAGAGRGEGWAGNISVDPATEPLIASALSSSDVARHAGESVRIFGPYWTDAAAVLAVGDFVFVMGGPTVAEIDDDTLIDAAGELAWSVGDVSAEKQLADELEVTQAALAVATLPARTVDGFLAQLAVTAADALACEFGAVVVLDHPPRVIVAPNGWQPGADEDRILDALLELIDKLDLDGPDVAQDLRVDPHADSPLGFGDGLVSRCVIPLRASGCNAALVVAHTETSPRGFTNLCQLVAGTIGNQATMVLSQLSEA